jgi:hypothetical protein
MVRYFIDYVLCNSTQQARLHFVYRQIKIVATEEVQPFARRTFEFSVQVIKRAKNYISRRQFTISAAGNLFIIPKYQFFRNMEAYGSTKFQRPVL